jgi:hypothetical protein
MVTAEQVVAIGIGRGTDPGQKTDPKTAQLQAIINLTDVLKLIAIVLIDIRDGKKAPGTE